MRTHNSTKRRTHPAILSLMLVALLGWAGCDLLDPSNVTNTDTTEDSILDLPAVAEPWLNGLERQMALVYNEIIVPAEVSTDNYANTNNFYLNDDGLAFISDKDQSIEDLQFDIGDLRESAIFGLTTVREQDENTTNDQLAEFHFFKGMAHLLSGMYFKTLPAENNAAPVSSEEQYRLAIADFDEALSLSTGGDKEVSYHLGKARAYYYLGDKANAVAAADAAIAADGNNDYVRFAKYDGANNLTADDNTAQSALFDRSTDDLQPLPRLDFLDPKYTSFRKTGDDESDIPVLKIEEAHLIKAEASIADGNVGAAQQTLTALLGVVDARPLFTLVDSNERRSESTPGSRPDDSDWLVKASPQAEFQAGLVLTRNDADAEIQVPTISGTSVDADQINAVSTADEALELVHLMRQEIFLAEGIRAVDFGIKWPVHENEALFNKDVTADDRQAFIPSFLPVAQMDAFTIDFDAKEVVIQVNMNRVLVENKSALPFF